MMQEQTIGQRIQLLRKAAALSQEALAAQVGVSRQAISKWEAGLSLPGIDNLQALAQVLCVSVDELLGGAAPAAQQLPPGESVALESVQALLLAQSEAERARRRRALAWKLAIAAPAVALVTVMMFTYQARLDDLQGRVGSLSGDVNSLHSTIQGEINGIRSGIEESLREQASLVASYDYTLSGYDQITHTVQLSVNAVAKQAVDGTSASFILTSPAGKRRSCPRRPKATAVFTALGGCLSQTSCTFRSAFFCRTVRYRTKNFGWSMAWPASICCR